VSARFRRRPGRLARDAGFSLVEVMVGAAVMSTVMAIATAGLIQMYHATERSDAAASVQANLTDAFARMDREIRYAYRINPPYLIGTTAYGVDYIVKDENVAAQCVQLTLPVNGGSLIRLQWPQTSNSADPAAVRTGVAADLFPGTAGTSPFTVRQADLASNYDRLEINVSSTTGLADNGASRTYNLQFTALNTTTTDTAAETACTKA
jgi:prepilin-type N-terminal cleavage/methylation domain-containing protein